MIYGLYFTFLANQGKQAEVRQVIEQRARAFQAEGVRTAVQVPIASLHGAAVYSQIFFDSIEGLRALRENPPAERVKATQEMNNSLAGLLREPMSPDLYEVLLPAQSMDWPVRYQGRVMRTPAPGKATALREWGLELARTRQAQGRRLGYGVQVAGSHAGTTLLLSAFASLEDWEANRASIRSDPEIQRLQEKLADLTVGTQDQELLEVVVPLQPRT